VPPADVPPADVPPADVPPADVAAAEAIRQAVLLFRRGREDRGVT
jgi:hypothetical protein